jgi:hypothetical protein
MGRVEGRVAGKNDLIAASAAAGESRRAQADRLLWEIPALGLTAQAFLSTIALAPNASDPARFVASLTALVFITAAFQSLLKHRYHEGMWSRWLERFERQASLPRLNSPKTVLAVARTSPNPDLETPAWLYRSPMYLLKPYGVGKRLFGSSAFRVWATALVAVIVIDLAMTVLALLAMTSVLSSPFARDSGSRTVIIRQSAPAPSADHGPRASRGPTSPSARSATEGRSAPSSPAFPKPSPDSQPGSKGR